MIAPKLKVLAPKVFPDELGGITRDINVGVAPAAFGIAIWGFIYIPLLIFVIY